MLTAGHIEQRAPPSHLPAIFIKNLIFPAMALLISLPSRTSGSWKLDVIPAAVPR